jgi:hypothetical protein
MDKDKEDFTFAKLSDITLPVTFRMYVCPLSRSFQVCFLECFQIPARRNKET